MDNDLTLVQQDLTSGATTDLGQSSILGQTSLQDPLELTGTNLDQQILNQQVELQCFNTFVVYIPILTNILNYNRMQNKTSCTVDMI